MSHRLRSLSPDLQKLQEDKFDFVISDARLVVREIPYVNADGVVCWGALSCPLDTDGEKTLQPTNHTMMFAGSIPYDDLGASLESRLIAGGLNETIDGIVFTYTLSRVPESGRYNDFYEKVTTYCSYLCPPAKVKDPSAVPYRGNPVETADDPDEVFCYLDTNAARGSFVDINERFADLHIGIIGVGGTGSYVLDLVSKCQVAEIRLIDGDTFRDHNAFRAPGAASIDDLKAKQFKVNYFADKYSRQHKKIVTVPEYVTADNLVKLAGLNFVFLCIDPCPEKKAILDFLLANKIPFIDSGIGVERRSQRLAGQVRTTMVSGSTPEQVVNRIPISDGAGDEYATNIQVADLNALAAIMAVIRWKKFIGFYDDLDEEWQSIYVIDGNAVINSGPFNETAKAV